MDDGKRGSLAAVLTLAALLLAALIYFGPGVYRSWLFHQRCEALLADALAGKRQQLANYVLPEQQKLAAAVFQTAVPANYRDYLQSLKLSSFSRDESDSRVIWALVTARLDSDAAGGGLAQGKLRWIWNGRSWDWDFEGSYGAEFPTSGEANWIRLGDFITIEAVN